MSDNNNTLADYINTSKQYPDIKKTGVPVFTNEKNTNIFQFFRHFESALHDKTDAQKREALLTRLSHSVVNMVLRHMSETDTARTAYATHLASLPIAQQLPYQAANPAPPPTTYTSIKTFLMDNCGPRDAFSHFLDRFMRTTQRADESITHFLEHLEQLWTTLTTLSTHKGVPLSEYTFQTALRTGLRSPYKEELQRLIHILWCSKDREPTLADFRTMIRQITVLYPEHSLPISHAISHSPKSSSKNKPHHPTKDILLDRRNADTETDPTYRPPTSAQSNPYLLHTPNTSDTPSSADTTLLNHVLTNQQNTTNVLNAISKTLTDLKNTPVSTPPTSSSSTSSSTSSSSSRRGRSRSPRSSYSRSPHSSRRSHYTQRSSSPSYRTYNSKTRTPSPYRSSRSSPRSSRSSSPSRHYYRSTYSRRSPSPRHRSYYTKRSPSPHRNTSTSNNYNRTRSESPSLRYTNNTSQHCWGCGKEGHWRIHCELISDLEREAELDRLIRKFKRLNQPFNADEVRTRYKMSSTLSPIIQNSKEQTLSSTILGNNPKAYCIWCHARGHTTSSCTSYCPYCETLGHGWRSCINPKHLDTIEKRKDGINKLYQKN